MKFKALFARAAGDTIETDLESYRKTLEEILSRPTGRLGDAELKAASERLIGGARAGGAEPGSPASSVPEIPKVAIEAFALVREASRRVLGLDPFDVQIISGLAMAAGRVAELPTGEGKTLAAVFPAYLHALSGRGVHLLTFNDYLARRDASWMGPVFASLGLSVGCVQEGMPAADRRRAYASDITYAAAREAGFDYLRDRLAIAPGAVVHRPFHMALVDEADSVLIDEARVPLVISGTASRSGPDAMRLAALARTLERGLDYATDTEHRNVFLTDAGLDRVEAALRTGGLYDDANRDVLTAVHCALHAEALLRRDVDYIVRDRGVEIVDEFTGRVVDGRHWPDGLQAAVEAKEGIARIAGGRILGSIALQQYFALYPRLCGMTATARSAAPELAEFYGLKVVVVPPHVSSIREDLPDAVFTHAAAKREALIREIVSAQAAGRPVLVGTASVRESEGLAAGLKTAGILCEVLNAKNDEREAGIIARAGQRGAVTISTNMAGRGTDIKLGGPDERDRAAIAALGGLYVIGTNRHESLRIDRQLKGRAGRQGDPGSSRFFIGFEDDIFVRYGLEEMLRKRYGPSLRNEPVAGPRVLDDIAHAQRIIEGQNFDIRRSLRKYSALVERQRRIVQEWRAEVLIPGELKRGGLKDVRGWEPLGIVPRKDSGLFVAGEALFGKEPIAELERRLTLLAIDRAWSDHLAWVADSRESIHLVAVGGKTPLDEFVRSATAEFLEIPGRIENAVVAGFASMINRRGPLDLDADELKGPASTWTYLVNEDQFGWGMEMLKGRNIGLAAGAALYAGPLFLLTLLLRKFRRSGRSRNSETDGRGPGRES
jgi:preprotein translocase subunit SecA